MAKFAADTSVPVDRSRAEIERILIRYGATGFMYAWQQDKAAIAFQIRGKQIRFVLPLPDKNSRDFTHTPVKDLRRTPKQAEEAWEQGVRQRWRALALVIKAKLEAIEAGISTLEEEFLAFIVLPAGPTVGQWLLPQIEESYRTGELPPMLPLGK